MSKVFLGGSRKFPYLNSDIRTRLRNMIIKQHTILVGDANGADKAVQNFFAEENYKHVVVYCMDGECRNNLGNWNMHPVDSGGKKKDFGYFVMKDEEMSRQADQGFMLWDGKSKGTLNNILNFVQQQKPVLIYFSPSQSFKKITSTTELEDLISQCDSKSKAYFEKTIKLSDRIQTKQKTLDLAYR